MSVKGPHGGNYQTAPVHSNFKPGRQIPLLSWHGIHFIYGDVAKVASVEYKLWAGVPERLYETGDIDATDVSLPYIDEVTDPAGPYLSSIDNYP